MSDDYTPTTEQIRGYIHEGALGDFDRWLTALDGEIRTAALEEAATEFPGSSSHPVVEWLRDRAANV